MSRHYAPAAQSALSNHLSAGYGWRCWLPIMRQWGVGS